jgi:epoxyqueuosine reductase
MERRRGGEDLVRAGEVAAVVPSAAGGDAAGHSGIDHLRGSRFLSESRTDDGSALKAALAQAARELGFDVVGVTRPDSIPQAPARLRRFLAEGAHGDMAWLAANADRRGDPRVLWPDVRAIILLGLNYGGGDPLAALRRRDCGTISIYARGDDYHDVIKPRLKALARWLTARAGGDVKVFVDTAAVMEKPLAAAAGLGWQGKHTNLVSRELGSWLLLGAIFTTLALPPDTPEPDHCGSCRACLDSCPTNAFPAPYRLDARRCISYLTIEHKGPIPHALRPAIGNRIYGCDDCLAACPWNKFAQASHEARLAARPALEAPPLAALATLDDAAFRAMFARSPIKRTGRDRFVRNVLIAIGNSGDVALAAAAESLLADASALVRGAAIWALGRLLPPPRLAALAAAHRAAERDPSVAEEWTAALAPCAA